MAHSGRVRQDAARRKLLGQFDDDEEQIHFAVIAEIEHPLLSPLYKNRDALRKVGGK